jgi:glycosyltransferase involved in cell wall biosynthesis
MQEFDRHVILCYITITMKKLRIALVHDWLTGMRGGEKCLEVLCELFPDAPLYTLLHVKGAMSPLIESRDIRTSFIQHLPLVATQYRSYLPLFPCAIESLDLSSFDVVISTSHCVAKGAVTRPGALHICYCHTPMRYVWEMYDEYFGKGKAGLVTRAAMAIAAPWLRSWDVRTAGRVRYYIANSENVRKRIQAHYRMDAEVIFPPVDTRQFMVSKHSSGYYLIVSALVPYKKVDLAIEAFNRNGRRLVIVGKGPEEKKLRALAGPNVEFLGWRSDDDLAGLYAGCRALIFPGEEDFGIVPLEAMACGKPIIAYGRGGALETVVEGETGTFFTVQSAEALGAAVEHAERTAFTPETIRAHALLFSRDRYASEMLAFIEKSIALHC